MIPMIVRLDVRDPSQRGIVLLFPVILVWILVFALLIAVFPFVLVAALFTIGQGLGKRLLLFYPFFFGTVFALSGLRVDVMSHTNSKIFISFD
jgi:uncharacterized membrane protein